MRSRGNVLVESLVGNGNGVVKVKALVHISKALAKGHSTIGIPRV